MCQPQPAQEAGEMCIQCMQLLVLMEGLYCQAGQRSQRQRDIHQMSSLSLPYMRSPFAYDQGLPCS